MRGAGLAGQQASRLCAGTDRCTGGGLLDGIGMGASGEDAAKATEDAIRKAAAMADDAGGQELGTRMIRQARGGGRKCGDRPTNNWYNRECDDARKACVATVGVHGSGSVQAVSARKEYKRVRRRALRAWREGNLGRKRDRLMRSPRTLWATYRGRQGLAPVDVGGSTRYFEDLFKVRVQEGDMCMDEGLSARLFGQASAGEQAFVAAGILGRDMTELEVTKATSAMAQGKSAQGERGLGG